MLNKVMVIGRLGRDPEVRTFQNGGKVCNLSVATTQKWKDRATGERKERTEWHRVAIFNERLAEMAEQYMKKGTLVYVEGSLETRKWTDQEGKDRYYTEIILRQFNGEVKVLMDGVRSDGSDADEKDMQSNTTSSNRDSNPAPRGNEGSHRKAAQDEDIPY